MIKQDELNGYVELRRTFEALKKQFEEVKDTLTDRLSKKEEVENGTLLCSLKEFDKTTTKYAEVVKGIQEAIQDNPELMETLAQLLTANSTLTHVAYPEIKTEEVQVIKKVKKVKVA